ncbi:hypothetical protein HUT16_05090 [Kitasatospora sp. NA04385]|uniref:hypothetical protein n=1 Tax=Kitasatospora sp. NA04385 TaxID=2742135 RepID=UPI0015928A09|nr:hypothetical protein [Kitasatospora sp. NA04385]QKW18522.1 hypothetical protein HUT16_05090 [Kitasatospora sp. NA04385]
MAAGVVILVGAVLLAVLLLSAALAVLASGSHLKRAGKGCAAGCGLLLFPLAVLALPPFLPPLLSWALSG